jgi:phenylacetate-CoA ligase
VTVEGRAAALLFRRAARGQLVTRWLARLDAMATWPADAVADWQRARLARVLRTARRFVPAYRRPAYRTDDLEQLPILTKDDVRREGDAFRNRWVPARHVTTGGTGGRPLPISVSAASFFSEWAHVAYAWRTAGIAIDDPKLTFRGSSLGRGFDERPVFLQPAYNHLVVSPFHLNDGTFRAVIAALAEFRPRAIWGYPSAIAPFARWVERTGPHAALARVRAVLVASEAPFEWQLRLFRDVFGARVVQWYGLSEKAAFASGCPEGRGYHVLPTYGIVEVPEGRIVGSSFTNAAMPLVRYDTDDGAKMASPSCSCGLPFPVLSEVRGRWDQSLLWGKDDEPISTSALNFHDAVFTHFDRFQFRQTEPGRASLLVTPVDGSVGEEVLGQAAAALQRRVGDRITLELRRASPEELLSRQGKVVAVDQRYRPEPGDASGVA